MIMQNYIITLDPPNISAAICNFLPNNYTFPKSIIRITFSKSKIRVMFPRNSH